MPCCRQPPRAGVAANIGLSRSPHPLADRTRGIGAQPGQIVAQDCIADIVGKQIDLALAHFEPRGHPVAPGEDGGDRKAGEEIGGDEGLQQVQLGDILFIHQQENKEFSTLVEQLHLRVVNMRLCIMTLLQVLQV